MAASGVPQQDRLSAQALSGLVTDLAAQKYWGVVRIKDGSAAKEFDFASGGVRVTSIGVRKAPPLGEIFVRKRCFAATEIDRVLKAQQEKGGLFGEICVQLHLVDEETRAAVVREQALAEWTDLYFWNGARYEYVSGQSRPHSPEFDAKRREAGVKAVSYTGDIGKFLGDAKQAAADFEKLQREVGSGETIYRFTAAARDRLYKQGGFQRLVDTDQRVVVLLDGKRSLSEIVGKVPLGWVETLRIIHKLIKAGALEKLK